MADWRSNLGRFFEEKQAEEENPERSAFSRFILEVVVPAFEEIGAELEKHDREVIIRSAQTSAALIVSRDGEEEMTYRVRGRTYPNGMLPFAELRFRERKGLRYIRVESAFRSGAQDYKLTDISQDEIIASFLDNYTRRVKPE